MLSIISDFLMLKISGHLTNCYLLQKKFCIDYFSNIQIQNRRVDDPHTATQQPWGWKFKYMRDDGVGDLNCQLPYIDGSNSLFTGLYLKTYVKNQSLN